LIAKNNLISRYYKKDSDIVKVNDKENYDKIMKQLDDFDLKFDKTCNDNNNITENKFLNDDLTATAFFKNVNQLFIVDDANREL